MIAQQTICLYIFYFTCVIISSFVMLTLKDHLRSMKILKFRNLAFILLAFVFRTFHLCCLLVTFVSTVSAIFKK